MSGDEYHERQCECGHREHGGLCRASTLYYAPVGAPAPGAGVTRAFTHKRAADAGLAAWTVPCSCAAFYEYEGEQP